MSNPDQNPARETQSQWSRVLWLDQEIRAGRYPNWESLHDEFGVSRRTAFNTITCLRDSLGAPLRHNRARKGYEYDDPTYGLLTVFLQEGELLALLVAEQVTRQYLGTPLEEPLREAIRKISRYLPDQVMVQLDALAEGFAVAGGAGLDVPLARMREVQRALRDHRVLRILYYTPRRDDVTEREIEPHFLINVRGDWMVVAWDRLRGEPRTFMVARMRECVVVEKWFKPRPQITPEDYARTTFLTEHGEQPYEVVLRFDPYIARWIRERVWHPSQKLRDLEDGRLEMRLTVSGEGDLFRWILQHGRHVEVLEPDWLRFRAADELRTALEVYGEVKG